MYSITLTFERGTVGSRPLAIRRISDIHNRSRRSEKNGQVQIQIRNCEYELETYIISRRDGANTRNAIPQVLDQSDIRIPLTNIIAENQPISMHKDIATNFRIGDDSRARHILNMHRTTPHNLPILNMVVVRTRRTNHGASTVHAVGDQPRCALQNDTLIITAKIRRRLRIGARIKIASLREGRGGGG